MSARFGGLPTDVDVRMLFEAFTVPEVGTVIPYASIADILKTPARSNRFRTVVEAWRRRLAREHNVYLRASDGAYTAMTAPERVDFGGSKLRSSLRAMRRAHTVVGGTDRSQLTDVQRAAADHVLLTSATVIQAARLQARAKKPLALPEGVAAS